MLPLISEEKRLSSIHLSSFISSELSMS